MYKKYFKRFLDLIIAFVVLLLFSPIYLIVAVVLFVLNNGKVFFTQQRIGKNNNAFKLIKFKSMNDKKDKMGMLLPDVKRLTPFGKFIRKSSLDELPQLFNVLKGDMSIVGPRPLLPEYLPYYNNHHIRRHEVNPGITGLAQVSGRNNLTFGQRFDKDVEYVDTVSLALDITILYKTFLRVIQPSKDIKLGRPIAELDDIGITKGLGENYLNVKKPENVE